MESLVSLVLDAQSGALPAFSEIFRRFNGMAYNTAYNRLGDHEMAQDAVQEAFIEAFLCLPRLREPAAFPGWFRQIVCRQCIRLIRGKHLSLVPLEDAAEVAADDPSPHRTVEEQETREQLRAAVRSLPEKQRTVIELFYLQGHSYKEIAEFLGLPVTAIKKRLHLARRTLRPRIAAAVQGPPATPVLSRCDMTREADRYGINPVRADADFNGSSYAASLAA